MKFFLNFKLSAWFIILSLSFSIFAPTTILGQKVADGNFEIDLSSLTDINIEKQLEENYQPFPKELTIDDVRKMRAFAIEHVISTLDVSDEKFLKKATTKESIKSKLQEIKQLILDGGDYGAYVALTELKNENNASIIDISTRNQANNVIDKVLTSIALQSSPLKAVIPVISFPTLSPLKQFEKGVPIDQIACKENLVLMKKTTKGTPGCFKMISVQKIIDRGWGSKVSAQSMINP